MLPSISSAIEKADAEEKTLLLGYFAIKEEQSDTASISSMDMSMVSINYLEPALEIYVIALRES